MTIFEQREEKRAPVSMTDSALVWRKLSGFPMLEKAARGVLGDDAEMLDALTLFKLWPTGTPVYPWALLFTERHGGFMRAFPDDFVTIIRIELSIVEQETMEGEDQARQEAIWVQKLAEVKDQLVHAWQGRDSVGWTAV